MQPYVGGSGPGTGGTSASHPVAIVSTPPCAGSISAGARVVDAFTPVRVRMSGPRQVSAADPWKDPRYCL